LVQVREGLVMHRLGSRPSAAAHYLELTAKYFPASSVPQIHSCVGCDFWAILETMRA